MLWGQDALAGRDRLFALGERLARRDSSRAARVFSDAALGSFTLRDAETAERAVDRVEQLTGPAADHAPVRLLRALALLQGGRPARDAAALLAGCAQFLEEVDPLAEDQLLQIAAVSHLALDEPQEARRLLRRAVAASRAASHLGLLVFQLTWLSAAELHSGSWTAAYASASEAVRLAEDIGWRAQLPTCLAALARVEALAGRAAYAATAERAIASSSPVDPAPAYAASALGLHALGGRHLPQAAEFFAQAVRLTRERGLGVQVLLQFGPDLVEAQVRCGRIGPARELLEELVEHAARLKRRSALAATARCRGLLASSADEAEAAFAEALRWHDGLQDPFERARTELCLGEQRRRRKRRFDARAPLAAAAQTLDRLGAASWAERAGAELRLAGGVGAPASLAGSRALTPQELQVALAAADGLSNSAVARSLFLSVKTVEFHLGNVYRKLGLRSRTDLVRALASEAAVPDVPASRGLPEQRGAGTRAAIAGGRVAVAEATRRP